MDSSIQSLNNWGQMAFKRLASYNVIWSTKILGRILAMKLI